MTWMFQTVLVSSSLTLHVSFIQLVPKSNHSIGTTEVTLNRSMDFGSFVPIFSLNTVQEGNEGFVYAGRMCFFSSVAS